MRNLRLIITFWLASFAVPGISFALDLGEIDVSSFLNQPLKAEIKVVSARPGEIDDLLVTLASNESFDRAGLSRPNYLSDLSFVVKKNQDNDEQAIILVTTNAAIKESFLNFLVEADWSNGRVLREFTVLLDPPFIADNVPLSPNPTTEEIVNSVESSTKVNLTESTLIKGAADVVTGSSALDGVVVGKGDALWSIASQFKDSKHSMEQVMLAMQRANPSAFLNGNINNLKVGAIFRAPSSDELDQLNKQEAYAEVLDQHGRWGNKVTKGADTSASIASDDGGNDGSDQALNVDGEFSLLAPGDSGSESVGQGEGDADISALKNQLAFAEEQLDASEIEKQEMQSRIADLEARLSKFNELQKMIEIEDDSLAQLQANQAANLAQQEASKPYVTTAPSVPENDTEIVNAEIETEPKSKMFSIFDGILPTSVADLIPIVMSLIDRPIVLSGLGGLVLLILGFLLYRRSNRNRDQGQGGITISDDSLDSPATTDETLTPVLPEESPTEADDERSKLAAISKLDTTEVDATDSGAANVPDDVINEVDVYLAYGLHENAEKLLKHNLDADPTRADYRAKLLDTYFATKNTNDFSNEAELLKLMGSAGAEYWDKVQVMGYELAPDNALFSAAKDRSISTADMAVAKPEVADFDLGDSEDDTGLSETGSNLGEVSNHSDSLLAQTVTEIPYALDDDGISFNETPEQSPVADNNEGEGSSLDFDLDDAKDLSLESDLELDFNDDSFDSIAASDDSSSLSPSDNDEDIQFDLDVSSLDEDLDLLDLETDSASVANDLDLTTDDSIDLEEESLSVDMDISVDSESANLDSFVPDQLNNIDELTLSDEIDMNDIGDLMLPDDVDEVATKLDLARAFIDMGDVEGARGSLEEVLIEGNEEQKTEANELLENI